MTNQAIAEKTQSDVPLAASVLDHSALLALVDGDMDLLRSIAALFLDSYPPLLGEVRGAITRGDCNELARGAHTLKGSCGYFLSDSARNRLVDLEGMAAGGDLRRAPERLAELESEMEIIKPELFLLASQGAGQEG